MPDHSGLDKTTKRNALHDLCMQQGWRCFWCGQVMDKDPKSPRFRTLEHVIPIAGNGAKEKDRANLRAACLECNQTRGKYHGALRNVSELAKTNTQLKKRIDAMQTTIERHRITMAGRCYWCKWKFLFKEWLHKRKVTNRPLAVRQRG